MQWYKHIGTGGASFAAVLGDTLVTRYVANQDLAAVVVDVPLWVLGFLSLLFFHDWKGYRALYPAMALGGLIGRACGIWWP